MGSNFDTLDDKLTYRKFHEWSEKKLYYLNYYLEIVSESMKSRFDHLVYIDLFSGPGKYQDETSHRTILGSPLLALKNALHFTEFYFSECSNLYIEALKIRSQEFTINKNIYFYEGDSNINITKIVNDINSLKGSSLCVAFVDPEGIKELPWKTIVSLSKIKKIDLLINYCDMGIVRGSSLKSNHSVIDNFFGDNSWLDIYNSFPVKENMSEARKLYLLKYLDNLRKLKYLYAAELDEAPRMRNMQNAPLYRLIFASGNLRGKDFWRKAINKDNAGQMQLKLD